MLQRDWFWCFFLFVSLFLNPAEFRFFTETSWIWGATGGKEALGKNLCRKMTLAQPRPATRKHLWSLAIIFRSGRCKNLLFDEHPQIHVLRASRFGPKKKFGQSIWSSLILTGHLRWRFRRRPSSQFASCPLTRRSQVDFVRMATFWLHMEMHRWRETG